MNYLILFLTILASLIFVFFAGYTVAYKRFSSSIARLRAQLARERHAPMDAPGIVSNYATSSQQPVAVVEQQRQVSPAQGRAGAVGREYGPQANKLEASGKPGTAARKRGGLE